MDNNIPYDLPPDDDTEELPPREYKPIPNEDFYEFPVFDFPEIKLDMKNTKNNY